MASPRQPRKGSMQFWHRRRARRETPVVRTTLIPSNPKIYGFYGYKVGMTHVAIKDNGANSIMKGQVIVRPVTILECPPLKVCAVRFYKIVNGILSPSSDIFSDKVDKDLSRKIIVPKAKDINSIDSSKFDDLRLIVYTSPKVTSLPKKKPEVFELILGGKKEDKLAIAKDKLGKEILLSEAFKVNDLIDVHAITKGKGFQGPVKRFGVQIRRHKSEKVKRGPASLGPWCAQPHIMYRVAHVGQMGYHQRVEYNKPILMISDDIAKINPAGGYVRYGNVKATYALIDGSIPGPTKRMIRFCHAMRPSHRKKHASWQLLRITNDSKQG